MPGYGTFASAELRLSLLRFEPMDETGSLNLAIEAGVPREAVILYARWWQLEGWLRQLSYFVLRSTWGAVWESEINAKAAEYARRDSILHLQSPDTGDPLAYLDFSLLLKLIDDQWNQFAPFLLQREIWLGRCEEFKTIRNRIAHMRRPSRNDVSRIEITLTDLELGYREAIRALAATDRLGERPDDEVIHAYRRGALSDLAEHARRKYELDVSLSVSSMPWAQLPDPPLSITGNAGLLWQLSAGGSGIWVSPQTFQRHLPASVRDALVFAFIPYSFGATFAAAAVDDPTTVILALHGSLETFLSSIRSPRNVQSKAFEEWPGDVANLDPRILVEHLFAVADDPDSPGSIFRVS